MRSRSIFSACLCTVVIALFAGCNKPVSPSDLSGRWVPQTGSRKWLKVTNVCEIILQAHGTFRATVPDYMMTTFDKASGRTVTGSGRWSLASDAVAFQFDDVDGKLVNYTSKPLKIQAEKAGMRLFFYVEEEGGERFMFVPAQATPSQGGEK